ncbi:hypothetical protein CLF_106130 [Clonorchis sinensis]|uniref:Uncharacterized protein n=1 Tax=Clonorchis sinensis TaxID=79923 RepID=G7YPP1_CLOSI|nr:hypothetical protein CLF_106130 [Clonorchis sinensis]
MAMPGFELRTREMRDFRLPLLALLKKQLDQVRKSLGDIYKRHLPLCSTPESNSPQPVFYKEIFIVKGLVESTFLALSELFNHMSLEYEAAAETLDMVHWPFFELGELSAHQELISYYTVDSVVAGLIETNGSSGTMGSLDEVLQALTKELAEYEDVLPAIALGQLPDLPSEIVKKMDTLEKIVGKIGTLTPNVNAQTPDGVQNTADRSPSVSDSMNILLAAGGTGAELDELVTQVRNLAWDVMNKTNDAQSSLMQGSMWKAVRHALKDISFEKKNLLLAIEFLEDGQCIYNYDFVPKIRQLQDLSISLDVWSKILKQLSVSLSDTIAFSSTATADNFYATARRIIKSIVVNVFDYMGKINLVHQLDPSGDLSGKLDLTKQLLASSHRLLYNLESVRLDQPETILWPRTTLVSLEAYADFFRLFHSTNELITDKVETVADRTWNTEMDLQTMWIELLGDPPKRTPTS